MNVKYTDGTFRIEAYTLDDAYRLGMVRRDIGNDLKCGLDPGHESKDRITLFVEAKKHPQVQTADILGRVGVDE